MPKFISYQEAAALIPDGATVMFGGFLGCGSAHNIIAEIAKRGTKDLTIIADDLAFPNGPDGSAYYATALLVHNHQVKKFIGTHIGTNAEAGQQMQDGTLEVVFIPQGSFVETMRAAGAGLGGVLTPTGLGTLVETFEHVHSKVEVDGRMYLLERPLRAEFAVIGGTKIDRSGNIWYKGTSRNFSPIMATAADVVIAEAETMVEIGDIEPENIMTPGPLVDYVAAGKEA